MAVWLDASGLDADVSPLLQRNTSRKTALFLLELCVSIQFWSLNGDRHRGSPRAGRQRSPNQGIYHLVPAGLVAHLSVSSDQSSAFPTLGTRSGLTHRSA